MQCGITDKNWRCALPALCWETYLLFIIETISVNVLSFLFPWDDHCVNYQDWAAWSFTFCKICALILQITFFLIFQWSLNAGVLSSFRWEFKKVWNLSKSAAQAVLCEQKLQILSEGVSHSVSYTQLQLTPRAYFFFLPWKLQAPPSQCHHSLRCRKILWLYNHVMWHSGPSEQEKLAQSELWLVDEPIGFSGWQRRAEIRSP